MKDTYQFYRHISFLYLQIAENMIFFDKYLKIKQLFSCTRIFKVRFKTSAMFLERITSFYYDKTNILLLLLLHQIQSKLPVCVSNWYRCQVTAVINIFVGFLPDADTVFSLLSKISLN